MLLGILDEPQDERRHAHDRVGLQPPDGIPLQLGDAVPDADDAGTEFADAEEIGQSGHEPLVERGHQLHDVPGTQPGAGERLLLVVGQALQVLFRASEGHRVAQRPRRGHIVDDLLAGAAEKLLVEELQVLLLGEGDLHQILDVADLVDAYLAAFEHAAVVGRMSGEVVQRLLQQLLLKGLDLLGRAEFDVICKGFHGRFRISC